VLARARGTGGRNSTVIQSSTCSDMLRASSTSMPR
jgi:hypothetical protein